MTSVDHPKHYNQGGIECIDALDACLIGLTGSEAFCTGNAIKYLWRWKAKAGVEDLRKARWYIDRMIAAHERSLCPNCDTPVPPGCDGTFSAESGCPMRQPTHVREK